MLPQLPREEQDRAVGGVPHRGSKGGGPRGAKFHLCPCNWGCRISLGRAQPLQPQPGASPAPLCISSPQPLCTPLPWVPEGFRVTMGAGGAKGPCHAQGTPTVVSGICKAVMWVALPVPPQCSWALEKQGEVRGCRWGPGQSQQRGDWGNLRIACPCATGDWPGKDREKMRLGTRNMSRAPCWDLLLPWHSRDSRGCPLFPTACMNPRQGSGALG